MLRLSEEKNFFQGLFYKRAVVCATRANFGHLSDSAHQLYVLRLFKVPTRPFLLKYGQFAYKMAISLCKELPLCLNIEFPALLLLIKRVEAALEHAQG